MSDVPECTKQVVYCFVSGLSSEEGETEADPEIQIDRDETQLKVYPCVSFVLLFHLFAKINRPGGPFHNNSIELKFNPTYFRQNYTYFRQTYY